MRTSSTLDEFLCDQCNRMTEGEGGLPLEVGWIWIEANYLTTGWMTDDGGTFGSIPEAWKHFCSFECFSGWLQVHVEKLRLSVIEKSVPAIDDNLKKPNG